MGGAVGEGGRFATGTGCKFPALFADHLPCVRVCNHHRMPIFVGERFFKCASIDGMNRVAVHGFRVQGSEFKVQRLRVVDYRKSEPLILEI